MPTVPQSHEYARDQLRPLAGLLALALPGMGHFYLGARKRAALIAGGVLGMFLGGLFIGGVDCVDRREDFVWFLGQSLVGPVAFGVDYVHQNHFKVRDRQGGAPRSAQPVYRDGQLVYVEGRDPATGGPVAQAPGSRPPNTKSLSHMNELGTLFTTIAGFMNLICVIDAGLGRRRQFAEGRG